jgi:hypothetical protein
MAVSTSRISCRTLLKNYKYWLWPPNTYFPWWGFLSPNLEIYKFNTSVHNINTRCKLKLHKPAARLTMYQRSVYCNSINTCIHNKLLDDLAELISNKKCFLLQLKKYLTDNPFYSVEFLNA